MSGKDLFDSLLDAGDVMVPSNAVHASWFSPGYQARPRRVTTFSGIVSPDLPFVGACSALSKSGDRVHVRVESGPAHNRSATEQDQ